MQTAQNILSEFVGHECLVTCLSGQGVEIRANCLRLNRHQAVFEVYTPQIIVSASEVLNEFKIALDDRLVYGGRAVVSNVISTGTVLVCEVTLEESWMDVDPAALDGQRNQLTANCEAFLRASSKALRALPEFKLVVAEMQMFLMDLRQWMDQVEFGVRRKPSGDPNEHERSLLRSLEPVLLPVLARLFSRFDEVSAMVPADLRPVHSQYVKRVLHPLVLCAPFMYRSFQKPLGYSGDYEMVNMMMRDPYEGATAFAKMLNAYFLSTPPVLAHRNRLECVTEALVAETARHAAAPAPLKVFNLGCGPAGEIQQFMAQSPFSDRVSFTLLDFNDETIEHVRERLQQLRTRHQRSTKFQCLKRSVIQVLKEAGKPTSALLGGGYHLVYAAGLFDYLADSVCEKLVATFYDMLLPGGLLFVTNVHTENPSRPWMELVVDWHLLHRDRAQMLRLAPRKAPPDACLLKSDRTGLNLFLEVRKPAHG